MDEMTPQGPQLPRPEILTPAEMLATMIVAPRPGAATVQVLASALRIEVDGDIYKLKLVTDNDHGEAGLDPHACTNCGCDLRYPTAVHILDCPVVPPTAPSQAQEVARCTPPRERIVKLLRDETDLAWREEDMGKLADYIADLFAGWRPESEVAQQTLDSYRISPAVRDVALERATHAERGWTAEHDAEHGVAHLVELAFGRPMVDWRGGYSRAELVKAASLLVAAIELIDAESERS